MTNSTSSTTGPKPARIIPDINPHGTRPAQLIEGWTGWLAFLYEAQESARQAAPNGRDYTPADFTRARQQHDDLTARVAAVITDLERITEAFTEKADAQGADLIS